MTREEAIRIIKIVLAVAEDFEIIVQGEEFTKEKCKEAVEIVTKALEQEPCDDAISRQAVDDAIYEYSRSCDVNYAQIMEFIEKIPPVTPQYTEAEIQKMQELEQAEIQKAYELGKAEMQPCEDAISRQAAIDAIRKCHCEEWVKADIGASIEALSPVTPAEKVGQWKRISMDKYVQHAMAYYKCSVCGKDIIGTHNYCPSCGAKMQEVEE